MCGRSQSSESAAQSLLTRETRVVFPERERAASRDLRATAAAPREWAPRSGEGEARQSATACVPQCPHWDGGHTGVRLRYGLTVDAIRSGGVEV